MITLLGFIILIVSIVFFFGRKFTPEPSDEEKAGTYYEPPMFLRIAKKTVLIGMVTGLAITLLTSIFFYAKPGTAYAVQYLWGGDKAVFTQGLKVKLGGRTIPIQYEIPVQDIIIKKADERLPESDEIYYRHAKNWEFADAIKARIGTAIIIGMDPSDEEAFLSMADKNKSEDKLVSARIIPAIDGALRLTCKLMDAQDYISGEAASFDRYFRDQLQNGNYILEEYYEAEQNPEIIGDSTTVRRIMSTGNSKTKKYRIKYSNGLPMRDTLNSFSFKRYGLKVSQAQITDIDWEKSFDQRLDLQKNEVAQTQLEKQQAEREFYRAKKEVAAGEANKAKERAKLEKEQIQKTIAAETEAKVAAFNEDKEKVQVRVVELRAKAQKIAADATYYENVKRVQAGLTPQERAELELKIASAVSRNIAGPAGIQLPTYYNAGATGKSGGNDDPLAKIMELLLAKNLMGDSKKK